MKNQNGNKLSTIIFTAAVFIALLALHTIIRAFLPSDTTEFSRMTSVGVPKIMNLDTKEQVKTILNDPSMRKNWGLMATQIQRAWDITVGDSDVVIAVIDTGVDIHHPDLAGNIWTNPGESGFDEDGNDKSTNGKDNDGNGYVGDVHGWDFVTDSPIVLDNHGHGTHIAGIIAANGKGGGNGPVVGNCPRCKIMVLKYFDPQARGGDNLRNTIKAIRYATKMGAKIINYSGGGLEPNDEEFKAIKEAKDKGILFVAAAGNEHSNSDYAHYYPADYNLDNIISVTAVDPNNNILKTSNYGAKSVNLASPGEDIYSTLPNGHRGTMTGTSQATAFVSGVAGLVLSNNKEFNYAQVKRQIINTADELASLRGKTVSSGKLNSYAALAIQPTIPATGIPVGNNSSSGIGVVAAKNNPSEQNAPDILTVMKLLKQPVRASASSKN